MLNWLRNRLSPVKRDTPRWKELAEALEIYWGNHFDPFFDSVSNLRSMYTADEAGQLRKIAEYGEQYEQDMPAENRPVYFGMRKLELLQKETDLPIRMMMQRIGLSDVEWLPLYALSGDLYGQKFYTEQEITNIGKSIDDDSKVLHLDGSWQLSTDPQHKLYSGVFLTSRAVLRLNLTNLQDAAKLHTFKDRLEQVKPLHIVFDGFRYWMMIEVTTLTWAEYSFGMRKKITADYPWPTHRLDGQWQIASPAQHKLEHTITSVLSLKKSFEIPYTRVEQLGRAFKQLGSTSLKKLDGLWKLGNPIQGKKLDGSWKLGCVQIGKQYCNMKLDGSWWLGTTKKLDGGWKLGVTEGGSSEAHIYIRKRL